jgi:hypothetical protein
LWFISSTVEEKENKKMEVSEAAKQDLARYDIFLTVFMNRTIIITEDNINKIEAFLKYRMEIICKWMMNHILRRPEELSDVLEETSDAEADDAAITTETTQVESQEKPKKRKK